MSRRKPPPACAACRAPLTFALVEGKLRLALDKEPVTEGGTVAAYRDHLGVMTGRWLTKGDVPYSHEKRYRKHQCPKPAPPPEPAALFDASEITQ